MNCAQFQELTAEVKAHTCINPLDGDCFEIHSFETGRDITVVKY